MDLIPGKRLYFASDFHLGIPNREKSLEREKRLVQWLENVAPDAQAIYLLGDVFDFWFEYRHAIPRGYARLQGAIARVSDAGIPVHYFTGNHDMWTFGYLEEELGVKLHRSILRETWNGKEFYIGHGDGLGPGDYGYKTIKRIFAHPFCQWAFARLHPNFGIGLANFWSRRSRAHTGQNDEVFHGEEKEWLIQYCLEILKTTEVDYFLFGHRHLLLDYPLPGGARYVNLGDWFRGSPYAVFDGHDVSLVRDP